MKDFPLYTPNYSYLNKPASTLPDFFKEICCEASTINDWKAAMREMKVHNSPQGKVVNFNVTNDFITLDSLKGVKIFFSLLSNEQINGICFNEIDFTDEVWSTVLEEIANNKKIIRLEFRECVFGELSNSTADQISKSFQSQLQALVLDDLSISEEEAEFFSSLYTGKKIQDLELINLTDESIDLLVNDLDLCENLKILNLSGSTLSSKMAKMVAKKLTTLGSLKSLSLGEMQENELENWMAIASCTQLRHLSLQSNQNINDELLLEIFQNLDLTCLELQNSSYSTDTLLLALTCYETRKEKPRLEVIVDSSALCSMDEDFGKYRNSGNDVQIVESSKKTFEPNKEFYQNSTKGECYSENGSLNVLQMHQMETQRMQLFFQEIRSAKTITPMLNKQITSYVSAMPEWNLAIREQAFEILLSRMHLIKDTVPSDGNCLFHCIISLDKTMGSQCTPSAWRELLVALMRPREKDFVAFLGEDDVYATPQQNKWEAYCDSMLSPKMFPGPIELSILSEYLARPILVFDPEYGLACNSNNQLSVPDLLIYGKNFEKPPIRLYRSLNHFSPLYYQQ